MTVLTATMRMQLDAAGFVKNAAELAAVLDRDVKRIDALKAALKETGASDRLQASMMKLGAAEPQIEGMRRALERFRAEQGLVGVSAAQMTADQRKALRTFESVTAATMRQVIADERKHTEAVKTAGEARAAEVRREEEARVEAVRRAAQETIATEARLAAEIAAQDAKAENRHIAALAVGVAEQTKGEKRAAAVREAIEAEITAKVRTEAHARVAASQEEAVAIERIARHERELRVRAIQQETDAIVAARHRQAEADEHAMQHAQDRAGFRHFVLTGAAAAVSAHGVVHAGERVLEAGAERQSERLNMTNAGISPAEVVRIEGDALKLSTAVGNVSQTQVMEVAKELRSMIADPKELDKVLDPIIRAKSVLDSMDKTGAASSGIAQLLKAGELVGAAKDPERLTRLIDGWVRVMQVSGKTVTPDQIFEFVKYSKTAGATLSDRFLTTVGPSILQELGGSTTGNDVAMMSKTIATGFSKTHAGMREAARAGLIKEEDIDYLSNGEAKGLKPGAEHAVRGDTLFQTDPDKWVYEVLVPHLEAAGVRKQEDQLAWVQRVFTGTSADFIAKAITQRQAYDVHAENYGLAKGLGAVGENAHSAAVGVTALSKAIENLSANASVAAMQPIGEGLNWLAGRINGLAEIAKDNPVTAASIAGAAGAAGLGASGWLSYKMLNGFGLGTAATELTGAATALDAAAVKLGAGGAASTAEKVAETAAPGLGFASKLAVGVPLVGAGIFVTDAMLNHRDTSKALVDGGRPDNLTVNDNNLMLPGYDVGGWTGAGGRTQPAGIVHRGEFVVRQGPAARHRAILEAINRGDILPGYAGGGGVGLSRDGMLDRPGGVVPVSLATDSSSAAALRHVFYDAMVEALRRVKDEGERGGEGGSFGNGEGVPNLRYGRGGSGRYRGTPGTGQDYETGPHVALGHMGAKFAEKAPVIMDGLMKKCGLTREQAAGVLGNLGHESAGFTAYHEGGKAPGSGGVGWAQWTGPRRRAFEAWTQAHGLDPTSDEASWRYLTEGDPETPGAIAAVKRQSTVGGAMAAFEGAFERARVKAYGSRMRFADAAYGMRPRGAEVSAVPADAGSAQGGPAGVYPAWMDDRSRRELAGVNKALAQGFLAASEATGLHFRVTQGLRTQAEADANARSGRGVSNSQHLYGAAADIVMQDAQGRDIRDRAAYKRFADAFTAHSRATGGNARWLGDLPGRWGSDIVHFDQGIGYGQTHQRDPYGVGGPTAADVAVGNKEVFSGPQNPFLHKPATAADVVAQAPATALDHHIRAGLADTSQDAVDAARAAMRSSGAAARAVDIADSLDGVGDTVAQTKLGQYMHKGEWCTDFVNGALAKAGIKGTGNAMAESFRRWGHHVDFDKVQRGDVITMDFGKAQLQHTGFATGASKVGKNGKRYIGMTSGNHDDKVISNYWEPEDEIRDLRRAGPAETRDAERAVLSRRALPTAGAIPPGTTADELPALNLKVAGLDDLREAHGHIDAMHRKIPALSNVNLKVHHEGFGHQGDHAPGAVRTALNGNFGSDGRRFG